MNNKKIIAILTLLCFMFTLMPVAAFADTDVTYVAQIGEAKYETLLEAVNAASAGDTITMISDFEINDDLEEAPWTTYELPEGSTLDLNDNTLTIRYGRALFAGKNITIKNGTITPPSDKNTDYALYIGNDYNGNTVVETSATVEDVEVVNAGINIISGAKATIKNTTVTVNPNRKFYAVYANANANVTLESGTYTGGRKGIDVLADEAATVVIYSGTFANSINEKYVATGCTVDTDAEGNCIVKSGDFVSEVGGVRYTTLLDAVNAAEEGDTITMIADFEINDNLAVAPYTVYQMPENSTLDLNGKTLTIRFARALFAGKNITICNGTITPPSDKNTDYALYIGNATTESTPKIDTSVTVKDVSIVKGGINLLYGAKATLENVNVTVNSNRKWYAVYANADANVTIESGSYTGGRNGIDVLADDEATITIYGGTFYKHAVEEKYCAAGYVPVTNEDGTYTVKQVAEEIIVLVKYPDGDTYKTYSVLQTVGATELSDDVVAEIEVPAGYELPDGPYAIEDGSATITFVVTPSTPSSPSTTTSSGGGFSGSYNYPINVTVSGADVTLSDNYAVSGETVTITVTPDAGKQVDEVIVTDADGDVITVTKVGDNQYSFTMPAGKVNVSVTTEAIDYDTKIVLQIGNKNVVVDGRTISNDVAPVIQGDRTLVPIRVIVEALGGNVDWNEATRTVTITIDGKVLTLVIDEMIPGFGQGATIMDSRTYVPIRYVAEYIGAHVDWIAETQQIVILK